MERIPADKWTANNKIAVGAANMLLVMPEYDVRVLNEVLNSVTDDTLNRDLKEMLVKKGAELQGAFILNLLLDGVDQPFENSGIPTEDTNGRPSYKREEEREETTESTTTWIPAPTTETSTATTTTMSNDEESMTIEETKKFMLNPVLGTRSDQEIYAEFKKLKYVEEVFMAMTYEEKAQVILLFDNKDDFLWKMPLEVIRGCVKNLPNVPKFVYFKDFPYVHFPKTLEKLHFGAVDTIKTTKRFMLHDMLKNLYRFDYSRIVFGKKYHKEAFASMTNEEIAHVVSRLEEPDDYIKELPFDVVKRCVENLPKVRNVDGFDPDKFTHRYFKNTFRVYILTKTKAETIENTKELMLSEAVPINEYENIVCNRRHWKEAFASMTYREMAFVLIRVNNADEFLSQMPISVIERCNNGKAQQGINNNDACNRDDGNHGKRRGVDAPVKMLHHVSARGLWQCRTYLLSKMGVREVLSSEPVFILLHSTSRRELGILAREKASTPEILRVWIQLILRVIASDIAKKQNGQLKSNLSWWTHQGSTSNSQLRQYLISPHSKESEWIPQSPGWNDEQALLQPSVWSSNCPNCPHPVQELLEPQSGQLLPGLLDCANGNCLQQQYCPQHFHWNTHPYTVHNLTIDCEPYGCGYFYGESYGFTWPTLYTHYPGYEDHTRISSAAKREILLSMPNIPFCSANQLFFLHPSFARYIIARHLDTPRLLSYMDEPVLYKMISINPGLCERIATFTSEQIASIFGRTFNYCHFLQKFPEKAQNIVMLKVKELGICKPTTTTTTTAEPSTQATNKPLFSNDEIVAIEAKIPKIRKLLRAIPMEKAEKVRLRTKGSFNSLFLRLPGHVIEKINGFLDLTSNLESLSPSFIAERAIGKPRDLYSILIKQMKNPFEELICGTSSK
nr:expressed protein [Hymenolepis microstoma]